MALLAFGFWLGQRTGKPLSLRVPGTDHAPGAEGGTNANPVLLGKTVPGPGKASALPGEWPEFRGPGRDAVLPSAEGIARTWSQGQPKELWGVDVGEGYAGPAVHGGRVYLMDYDQAGRQDAVRCLSLDDGKELWRFTYPVPVKRNHGMSRTVPWVNDKLVLAMGPKCHLVCVDAATGQLKWGLDLVREFGVTVPPWYAGQCPLVETNLVVLGLGGPNALMAGLDLETGKVLWQTPNPNDWKMTHSSVMRVDIDGTPNYVYCASKGVVAVDGQGKLLWETPDWKISIATVPSPLPIDNNRVFLTGGYNAGSMMLQITKNGEKFNAKPAYRLEASIFGATQHTPIFHQGHIYGTRADGKFVCLSPEGKVLWTSPSGQQFGLGPYLLAGDLFFVVNDNGLLRMIQANPSEYQLLGQAEILKGRESWAPLALVGTRLLARDLTRLVCLELGK